jgi:hypothetical protein
MPEDSNFHIHRRKNPYLKLDIVPHKNKITAITIINLSVGLETYERGN